MWVLKIGSFRDLLRCDLASPFWLTLQLTPSSRFQIFFAGSWWFLMVISPNLCVGFLFLILYPAPPPPPLPPPPPPHNIVTRHLSTQTLSHTIFSHTTLSHTLFHSQLCYTHTPSLSHNFVTHYLSHTTLLHTTLSHTIFHTHNFVTHYLSHTHAHNFVTHHLSHTRGHTTLSHTGTWRGTSRHRPSFCVAGWHLWHWAGSGGALGPCWSPGAPRHFAWQAWWHLATWT